METTAKGSKLSKAVEIDTAKIVDVCSPVICSLPCYMENPRIGQPGLQWKHRTFREGTSSHMQHGPFEPDTPEFRFIRKPPQSEGVSEKKNELPSCKMEKMETGTKAILLRFTEKSV